MNESNDGAAWAGKELPRILSHDLRTPLTSIIGFLDILLNRDVSADRRERYLRAMLQEAKRLDWMIEGVVDLQHSTEEEQERIRMPVDVEELLEETAQAWSQLQKKRLVLGHSDDDLTVYGDPTQLRRMFLLLLTLMANFMKDDDYLSISVQAELDHVAIMLCAQDHCHRRGGPLPPKDAERMVTKHGLYAKLEFLMIKQIARAHGADFTYEASGGALKAATLELPLHRLPELSGAVAVVTADEAAARALAVRLEEAGYKAVWMTSAEDMLLALQRLRCGPPALCVTALKLTGQLNGWELLARLRRAAEDCPLPVLVMDAQQPAAAGSPVDERTAEYWGVQAALLLEQAAGSAVYRFRAQSVDALMVAAEAHGLRSLRICERNGYIDCTPC